jgi:PAS domain S-box-containing protein
MSLPEMLQLRREEVSSITSQPYCLLRCSDLTIIECNDLFCDALKLEHHHVLNATFDKLGITYPPHSDYKNAAKHVLVFPTGQAFRFVVVPLEQDGPLYHLFILTEHDVRSLELSSPQQPVKLPFQPKHFLSKLFYHSPVPAVINLLSNRMVIEANQSFLELVDFKRQDLIGRDVIKLGLITDLKSFGTAERKLQEGKSALPVEQQLRCKNGVLRTVLVSAEPFGYNHQACAITTFVDITERKHTKEQLSKAIRAAIQDTEVFSRGVIEKLSELDHHAPDMQLYELTEREREVLGLLAEGFDNDHIAKKLFLAEHTVRNYVMHIYEKLGLHSRAEAIVWARERGLVSSSRYSAKSDKRG